MFRTRGSRRYRCRSGSISSGRHMTHDKIPDLHHHPGVCEFPFYLPLHPLPQNGSVRQHLHVSKPPCAQAGVRTRANGAANQTVPRRTENNVNGCFCIQVMPQPLPAVQPSPVDAQVGELVCFIVDNWQTTFFFFSGSGHVQTAYCVAGDFTKFDKIVYHR